MTTELNTPTTWDRAVEIANVPAVHEAIAALCEDATEDNAVCAIQSIVDAALTQRPAAQQLESAAKVCDGFAAPDMAAALRGQRPAAQTEREAFEAWARPNGYDLRRNDVLGHYSSIDTSRAWSGFRAGRASLPAPQQATPDHFPEAKKMVPDQNTIKKVTPEPVGEPFCFASVNKHGDVTSTHKRRDSWRTVPLYTRHAPGVPEGLIEYLRHVRETFANGPMANVPQVRGQIIALDVWIDALAAAQAKGGEHG